MKKLIVVLASLMFATGAFAAEYKLSGDFKVTGTKIINGGGSDDADYDYYDQDMNLNVVIKADDKTTVTTKFAIMDYDWKGSADYQKSGNSTANDGNKDFVVERAFISYKITPELTVNAGLMTGGAWAAAFGNDAEGKQRIKFDYALGKLGSLTAFAQKNAEKGLGAEDKEAEKADNDMLAIGANLKFAGVTVAPLLQSKKNGNVVSGSAETASSTVIDIYAAAKIAMVSLEAEYIQETGEKMTNGTTAAKTDVDKSGYWVKAKADLGKFNVAAEYATASGDENADDDIFEMADDYEFVLLGDDIADGLAGVTLWALTAGTSFGKLGLDAAFISASDTESEDGIGTEIDLTAAYALTDATAFTLQYAIFSPDSDNSAFDKDMSEISWTLSTKF